MVGLPIDSDAVAPRKSWREEYRDEVKLNRKIGGANYQAFEPSADHIRRECERIQASWSAAERARRGAWGYQEADVVQVDGFEVDREPEVD